ncbi:RING/U-box superfamily protein [Zea mays]|uniref:RING/U-box superfamily protein n=1 Tax=Zea mays TaxID=4577 RepID=A0A1D6KSS3_MAIZE|nr:RING/U-box superfamily protein [Zea mays]
MCFVLLFLRCRIHTGCQIANRKYCNCNVKLSMLVRLQRAAVDIRVPRVEAPPISRTSFPAQPSSLSPVHTGRAAAAHPTRQRRRRPPPAPSSRRRETEQPVAAGVGAPCPAIQHQKWNPSHPREVVDTRRRAAKEEELAVAGSSRPPMSSGADGSDPITGLGPSTIPEPPDREPPHLQSPSPAAQQEVAASQAETPVPAVTIVISRPGEEVQTPDAMGGSPACSTQAGDGKATATSVSLTASAAAKEAELARSDSFDDYEQCRVCQQKTEEPLVDLGCRCRGDLAKAHRTCIDVWFRTRGSNKCEICQQVAANIPPPETQASTSYWVWRVDSTYGRGRGGRERPTLGCICNPDWWSLIGCADICFSWCFRTSCQYNNWRSYSSRIGHRPSSCSRVLPGMGLKEERRQYAEAGEHTADWVPPCSSIIIMGLVNSGRNI